MVRIHLRKLSGCTGCMPLWDSFGVVRSGHTLQNLIGIRSKPDAVALRAVVVSL